MSSSVTATRYHDISCGHRVAGHESKCAYLHGHNYRITFTCVAEKLDGVGRVIDFAVMNSKLCLWLEDHWDHRFIAWEKDPLVRSLGGSAEASLMLGASIVYVPFNPTAENMALHLLYVVGPKQLEGTGVKLVKVLVEETRKCSAAAEF